VKRGVPQKSAKMIRTGRKIVINGETHTVTDVGAVVDPTLGPLVVLTCGDREFRRPPNARIEVVR
jgi:hypothetical protein